MRVVMAQIDERARSNTSRKARRWSTVMVLGLISASLLAARAPDAKVAHAVTLRAVAASCLPSDDRADHVRHFLNEMFMRSTPIAQARRMAYGMVIAGPTDLNLVTVDSVCARASAGADVALNRPVSGAPAYVFAAGNRYVVSAPRYGPPAGANDYSALVVLDSAFGFVRLLGF